MSLPDIPEDQWRQYQSDTFLAGVAKDTEHLSWWQQVHNDLSQLDTLPNQLTVGAPVGTPPSPSLLSPGAPAAVESPPLPPPGFDTSQTEAPSQPPAPQGDTWLQDRMDEISRMEAMGNQPSGQTFRPTPEFQQYQQQAQQDSIRPSQGPVQDILSGAQADPIGAMRSQGLLTPREPRTAPTAVDAMLTEAQADPIGAIRRDVPLTPHDPEAEQAAAEEQARRIRESLAGGFTPEDVTETVELGKAIGGEGVENVAARGAGLLSRLASRLGRPNGDEAVLGIARRGGRLTDAERAAREAQMQLRNTAFDAYLAAARTPGLDRDVLADFQMLATASGDPLPAMRAFARQHPQLEAATAPVLGRGGAGREAAGIVSSIFGSPTRGEAAIDTAAGLAGSAYGATAGSDEDASPQERLQNAFLYGSAAALGGRAVRGLAGDVGRLASGAGRESGITPIEPTGLRSEMRAAETLRQAEREALRAGKEATAAAEPAAVVRARLLGVPVPTLAEVGSAAQAAPLAAPGSLLQNFLSGGFRTVQRVLQEAPTDPAGAWKDVAAMGAAVPEALATAGREFRRGPSADLARGLSVSRGGLEHSESTLAKVLTFGTRANVATDRFWSALNDAGARAAAAARGLDELDAAELGGRAADFAAYRGQTSPVAEALSAGRKWVDDPNANPAKRALGAFLMASAPYVRTPERVLGAALSLATDPFVQPAVLVKALKEGNSEVAREATGRMLLGAAVDTWLAHEFLSGGLYGDPPQDQATRRRMEADGAQWNTLHGIPTRMLGTFGQAASAVATTMQAAQTAAEQGKDPAGIAEAGASEALRWALANSYLRDLARFGADVQEGKGTQAVTREVAGLATRPLAPVTGLVGAADPHERKTSGAGIGGEILSRLPGGRYALPVQRNELGQPLRRAGSGLTRALGENAPAGPEGAQVRKYLGSSGAQMDAEITSAINAVERWQSKPRDNPRPTAEQMRLWQRFHGRENPRYERARQAELGRQRQRQQKAQGGGGFDLGTLLSNLPLPSYLGGRG